jgi:hypothetical protein
MEVSKKEGGKRRELLITNVLLLLPQEALALPLVRSKLPHACPRAQCVCHHHHAPQVQKGPPP